MPMLNSGLAGENSRSFASRLRLSVGRSEGMSSFLKSWKVRIFLVLAVLGPGFITANVDNDAGGIFTYSQAGAAYGYTLLWTMIPITLALIVVQEMCARMGVVTGKGLSDLIREEFGLRMTFFMMILLVIVNFTNVITEFVGIAGSMGLFHISKFVSVPIAAVLVWALVVKGDYKKVEKIFLIASVFYIAYIVTGVISGPDWHTALVETVKLPPRGVWSDKAYVYMTVGVIGTTITPWMQFYLQSSIVDKGISVKQYKASRLDVIVGSIFTDVVAWFIIVACAATLFVHGIRDIPDASVARFGDAAAGGRLRLHSVRGGAVQRFAVCGVDPAAFDGVYRMRGVGIRERAGQDVFGGAVLLLVLHAADCAGRGDGADSALSDAEVCAALAGAEWRAATGGADLYAEADQQA